MLVVPDATYIDQATKQVSRIFPTGSSWLSFESRMPPLEVFRDSVLDEGLGTLGELTG